MGAVLSIFTAFLEGISFRCRVIPYENSIESFSLMMPVLEMFYLQQTVINWKVKGFCFIIARSFVLICNLFYFGKLSLVSTF